MFKVLLCGIHIYISACLRSYMKTAPDQNQRPLTTAGPSTQSEHLDQSFLTNSSVGLGIILHFLSAASLRRHE